MTPELTVISEALDALSKYCASASRIDTLHADALRELTALVRNLHERVTRLADAMEKLTDWQTLMEARVGTIERRFQDTDIDYTTPPGTFIRTKIRPLGGEKP